MSSATSSQASDAGRKTLPALAYRSWPLVDEWPRTALMLGLTACLAAIAYLKTEDWRSTALVVAVMALAVCRLWLPTMVEIRPSGIVYRTWRSHRVPWNAVKRWKVHDDGLLLLPDLDPSSFEALHGLFVPWGRHRLEVLALVEHYVGAGKRQE